MKNKIIYILLSISVLINSLLVIYITNMEPSCEHTHYDDIDRAKDMVSNEDTAKRIAEAVLRMEESGWGLKEDFYYTEITYNDEGYEWIVFFDLNPPDEVTILDAERIAGVRRDNGMVLFYGRNYENIGLYNDL